MRVWDYLRRVGIRDWGRRDVKRRAEAGEAATARDEQTRRVVDHRRRFWAELREGQRQAEACCLEAERVPMAAGKGKRWALIALVVLVVLIAGGIVGFRVAVGVLKGKVVEALGPESEITNLRVGWFSVDVEGLRIDATVTQPPLKIRLEQIQATVHDVVVPALTGKTRFDLAGVLKSAQRDGAVTIVGWAETATKDSSVKTTLRTVDLVALQPYFIKAPDTGVRKGTVDLDLKSSVRKNRLNAPGKLTISGLELAPAKGAFGTFMGVPRDAVVAFLENQDNKIAVNFVLEGDINNPQFSLNETLTTRLASSMAETLGVSLGGVATGVEALGRKGVEAAGTAGKGVGGAVQRLFRGQKKR